jgi:hypothetical protein
MLHLNEDPLLTPGPLSDLTGRQVKAWGAAPYIKHALKKRAAISVFCTDRDGNDRMMLHHVGFRPMVRLLWPLSLLEAHDVSVSVFEGASTDSSHSKQALFRRWQANSAIATFLEGVDPDAIVAIRVDDHEPPVAPLFSVLLSLVFSTFALLATNFTPFVALGWFAITSNWSAVGVICTAAGLVGALTCVVWVPFSAFINRTVPNRATWIISSLAYCGPLTLTALAQPMFIEKFREATPGTGLAWTLILASMLGLFPWVYAGKYYSDQVIFVYRGGLLAGMLASAYLFINGSISSGSGVFLAHALTVVLANGLSETIPDPADQK